MGYIHTVGMCSPKGYGFLCCFGLKQGIDFGHFGLKWFLHSSLELKKILFRRSYIFTSFDKAINKSPSQKYWSELSN